MKEFWLRVWAFLAEALTAQNLPAGAVTVVRQVSLTGYVTPKPPDLPESRDLKDCEPELVRRYALVKADFTRETGLELFETCTWRSTKAQQALFEIGRTKEGAVVTMIDGVKLRSRHNFYPSQAVDVCASVFLGPGKHAIWDPVKYAPLGPICERHGLVWGGSFKHFKDYPHIELPGDWDVKKQA